LERRRVDITLAKLVLERVDEIAKKHGMSRSYLIETIIREKLGLMPEGGVGNER